MGLIKKTMEVTKLDHQMRETQIQQDIVMEEAGLLLSEKLPFQANTKVMIANVSNKAKKYQREMEKSGTNMPNKVVRCFQRDKNQPLNM